MTAVDETIQERIATRAAEWFVLNRDGPSLAQRQEFVAWLKESPLHVREYLTIAGVSKDLETTLPYLPEVSTNAAQSADERVVRLPNAPATPDPPGERRASWSRRNLVAAAAASVVAVVVSFGVRYWGSASEYSTRRGEQRTLQLEDGSVVHLNTDSAVRIRFSRTARDVALERGQALFQVAHEAKRRFTVSAAGIDVVALGTRFDVYWRAEDTVVTVVEGTVAVTPQVEPSSTSAAGRAVRLPAGQQVRVPHEGWAPSIAAVNADEVTAWIRHEVVFDRKPLGDVAEELSRYITTPIEVRDPTLRALPVTGVLDSSDRAAFVEFLRRLEGVEVAVTAERIVVTREPVANR